ncbi:MAG: insulinase family protein [Candidatus Cloacimonetes bacterium]|nr:insulinase family protein [Candidatus Cloacimonadota bacterium]
MKISDKRPLALKQYIAPNTLKLLYAQDSSNPLICLQLYIRTGSVQEESSEQGYAHFLEHLSFKSTRKYPDNGISRKASEIGAMINAYTDYDATCYYLILPSEHLETGMEILAQMAFQADFDSEDLRTEKNIIIEEIYQYEAEPEMDFIEYIQTHYFEDSPLKRPVLGNVKSVKAASLSKLRSFYKKHYHPGNAFVVATGDFDEDKLKSLFNTQFGDWQEQVLQRINAVSDLPHSWRVFSRTKNGQEYLAIALPELNESHPDSEALHIAIRYLAIGKSSILHRVLVEKEKLCSSVKVSSLSGLLPGASVILFSPSQKGQEARIMKIFFKAWADLLRFGVPTEDAQLIKLDIIHNWIYSFDGVEHTANLIAAEEFNGDLSRVSNYGAYIESITDQEVLAAARRFWQAKYLAFFYQSKQPISPALHKALETGSSQDLPLADENTAHPYKDSPQALNQKVLQGKPNFPEFQSFRLSNGLKFIYNYLPGKDICGYALSSPLSQLTENKIGTNYFSTAMMLYGTQKRSHDEIMRFSRQHGFNIRVIHHLDSTIFRGKCSIADLPSVLDLLSEIVHEPLFDKAYLGMLKSAAADSIRRERDYPISMAYKAWFRQLFGKNNNLYSPNGDISDIASIKVEDCETWHESWGLGEDFALAIVGSLEPEKVYDLAEKYFGQGAGNKRVPPTTLKYDQRPASSRRVYKKLDQSIIHIGGIGCPASKRTDNSAFHVLAHIMGGDLSSRMYDILRERFGFAYQTGFDFYSIQDLGFWYAYAFCDPKLYLNCLNSMRAILADLLKHGITQKELDTAKNFLIAMSRFDNESASYKAATIANLISLNYDLDFYLDVEQRITNTNLAQIHDLVQLYLNPENQTSFVMV